MDAKVKALWLDALRSGEYEQAKGYLKTDDGYCCLGVLCDIAVKNKVIPDPIRVTGESMPGWPAEEPVYVFGEDKGYLTLPDSVREWAGLDEYNPMVYAEKGDHSEDSPEKRPLSELNDNLGFDFNRIADRIDADL
jgi:hypothetical protein